MDMSTINKQQMAQSLHQNGLTQDSTGFGDLQKLVDTPAKKVKLERSLDERLKNFGLKIIDTVTDGDCMLDALAKTFYLTEVNLVTLRTQLIDLLLSIGDLYVDDEASLGLHTRLRDYPTFGESFEQDASWEAYIKRMSVPGEYCDHNMLMAASIHFACPIAVIGNGIVNAPSQIVPPPHWNLHLNPTHVIVLGHIQENHYFGTKTIDRRTIIPDDYLATVISTVVRKEQGLKPAYVSLNRFWVEDRMIWCKNHKLNNDRIIDTLNLIVGGAVPLYTTYPSYTPSQTLSQSISNTKFIRRVLKINK
jgi:hypothetical protein